MPDPATSVADAAQAFKKGRDFAAWLGLTPLQRSTGGKQKLGQTSRMGDRTLRGLLIIGASAVVRRAMRKGSSNPWLARGLNRKPPMLVIVALESEHSPSELRSRHWSLVAIY
jgi:transposase